MVEEGQDWRDVAIPAATGEAPASTKPESSPASPPPAPAAAAAPAGSSQFVHPAQTGPATALLLTQYGLDPARLEASGPKGNLTKSDVLQYIRDKSLPPPAPPQVPLPGVAKPAEQIAPSSPPTSYSQS